MKLLFSIIVTLLALLVIPFVAGEADGKLTSFLVGSLTLL